MKVWILRYNFVIYAIYISKVCLWNVPINRMYHWIYRRYVVKLDFHQTNILQLHQALSTAIAITKSIQCDAVDLFLFFIYLLFCFAKIFVWHIKSNGIHLGIIEICVYLCLFSMLLFFPYFHTFHRDLRRGDVIQRAHYMAYNKYDKIRVNKLIFSSVIYNIFT